MKNRSARLVGHGAAGARRSVARRPAVLFVAVLIAALLVLCFGARPPLTSAAPSAGLGLGIEAPLPPNAAATYPNVSINSVSCPAAGNCTAVGSYTDSSGKEQGLLLTETGGKWGVGIEAVLPPGTAASGVAGVELNSVSCASPGNCTAVGQYGAGSSAPGPQGLLLTETNGKWAPGVEAVLPANARSSDQSPDLRSVSCASAGNCSAVGNYVDSSANFQGLLLNEMGGKWGAGVEVSLPANGQDTGGAFLDSVSCASAGNCVAVGYYEAPSPIYDLTRGLLVSETAGVWAAGLEAPLPANAATDNTASEVDAVSCASSGDCTAVGTYYDNSDKLQGLLLTETAGSWTSSVEAALPTNAAGGLEPSYGFYGDSASPLSAVSCASPGNCTAVGHYPDSVGNVQGVLLSESGGTWATGVEAPLPADAAATPQGVNLTSVDCSSPGNCDAAGSYGVSAGGGAPLVLTETAGAWTTGVEPSLPANSSQATFFLNSISCAAAGTCSAVGGYWAPSSGQFGLLIGGTPSPPPLVTLTVSTSGPTGAGTVSDGSAEISCKTSCSYSYPAGTPITLTATPAAPSTFAGWSGCRDPASPTCAGSAEASICLTIDATRCTATLDGDAAITARFRSVAPRSKPCVVPKLRGKTLTGATRSIRAHACALGRITRVTSSAAPRNAEVIAQSPKPGTRLEHRGVIDLTVTMPVHCRVPETVGLSVRAAERKLRAADCRVGEIKHWTSPLRRENHVIGQDPARGRTRSAGTRISLVVGRGPRTGSLPSSGSILPGKLPPFIAYDPPAGGIWLLRPDGSDSHRVGPLYGSGPVWSPDGTRILYTAPAPQNDSLINYDLYVMNADGTDRRPLMPSGGGEGHGGWGYDDFHWSPDGKQIVFTQGEYLRGNVGIANADGSDEHPVPNTSDGGEASFSPDGSYIVFYGDGGYVGQVHHHGPDLAKSGIYVIKPDGSGLRQLTFGGGVEDPSWSPDGTRIIYSCLMDGSRQAHAICELSGNPTRQRILYRNSNDTFVDPRWNADGTKILVTLDRSVFGPDGIALMSPSGGPPVMLAPLSFPGDSSWNSAPYNGWNADW